jgi:aromatic ring-opening dioxygenase LigB subunit
VALLVMGDGSACRDSKAPGYLDPRAEQFDHRVTTALRNGDAETLLALNAVLAEELMVAGRAPWQVLAGACPSARGEVLYDAAPYGVQYTVAYWEPK